MKALKKAEGAAGVHAPGNRDKAGLTLEPLTENMSAAPTHSASPARAAANLMLQQNTNGNNNTLALLALLGLVVVGMGGYFYLEISHPTLLHFASRPSPAISTPATPPAAAPIIATPAVQPVLPTQNQTKPAAPQTVTTPPPAATEKEETLRVIPGGAPAAVAPGLMSAYQALQEGRYEQARTTYERLYQADPRNLDVLLGLAAIALNQGRAEQAGQYYLRALEFEPRNAPAQAGLVSLVGSNDPAGSEARLKHLIARYPAAFLYAALGNLHAGQSVWPAAQQAYFEAFHLEPGSADYAFNLAVSLDHLNQTQQALEYYQRAQSLANDKINIHFDPLRLKTRILQLQRTPE